jgi:sortase A
VPGRNIYYHIDQKPERKSNKTRILFACLAAFILVLGGVYFLALSQSPEVIADNTETLKSKEDKLVNDGQNFLKIESLNLLVPFNDEDNKQALENGALWRYLGQGADAGGNFTLCGQRFKLGVTPNQTKEFSPFYHLDKLAQDSEADVYYQGQWYAYKVTETKNATLNQSESTETSEESELTLYTCSSNGDSDGHIVLLAKPVVNTNSVSNDEDEGGSDLLL